MRDLTCRKAGLRSSRYLISGLTGCNRLITNSVRVSSYVLVSELYRNRKQWVRVVAIYERETAVHPGRRCAFDFNGKPFAALGGEIEKVPAVPRMLILCASALKKTGSFERRGFRKTDLSCTKASIIASASLLCRR